ncbi:MAG: FAD-dependent oxidoreductase [Nocardioidaceae bacterium]
MDRRRFLRAAAVGGSAAALAACTPAYHAAAPAVPTRRPTPSRTPPARVVRPAVPSWAALAAGLDGELLRDGDAGFDAARQLYDPRFDAVVPAGVLRAGTPEDVAEAIRFARLHGLPLRPRSGGHSYVGASTVAGGLQLDLRGLDQVRYDPASQTVTVGAGAALFDLHAALDPLGRTVPTGTCPSVGAAGLTLGGGVGVESRAFGLTCDALEELTVVTADGRLRQVHADRDPDLFWASRGGVGGSLGVVTSMRLRTRPAHDLDFFFLRFADQDAEAMLRGWQQRVAVMPRSSWANVHLDAAPAGLGARIVGVSLAGEAAAEAEALVAAVGRSPAGVSTFGRSHHDGVRLLAGCTDRSDAQCHPAPAGTLARESFVAGSDVVGRPLGSAEVDRLVAHVRGRGAAGDTGTLLLDPLGGRVGALAPGATAFPWRRALGIAQWYVPIPAAPAATAVRDAYAWVRGGHAAFGTAGVGGYANYLEPGRPLRAYYGANLGRLRRVKAAYDPDDFFHSGFSIRPR